MEGSKQPTLSSHHEVVLGVEGLPQGDQIVFKGLDTLTLRLKVNFKFRHQGIDLGSLF